jgi:hypothetical protein
MARWLPESISAISDTENLEKVQNIAILFDCYEMHEESLSHLFKSLTSLLNYFVGIKQVTLVFGFLEQKAVSGGFRTYNLGEQYDSCFFIDPEVVEAACEADGYLHWRRYREPQEIHERLSADRKTIHRSSARNGQIRES